MTQQYDFIAIGDITVDAFIKLSEKDAKITTEERTGRKVLSMYFGGKMPLWQPIDSGSVQHSLLIWVTTEMERTASINFAKKVSIRIL